MKIVTLISAAAFAVFIAAPAEAGGFNPMPAMAMMMGPMMRLHQRHAYRRPPPPYVSPAGYGYGGGCGGCGGYGYGGRRFSSSHTYVHREWFHREWYRHYEVHRAAPVYVAPAPRIIVERPPPRVVVERPRVIVRRPAYHPHVVVRSCGCGCCCGRAAAVDPPGDPQDPPAADPPDGTSASADGDLSGQGGGYVPPGFHIVH